MHIQALDPALAQHAMLGWRLSRDPTQTYNLSDVLAVDAPVNELPNALLHFVDFTILEREIFFTLRNHVAWARTSRVDDPLLYTVPPMLAHLVPATHLHAMQRDQAAGLPQDTWRMHLPVLAHTSWVCRMDARTLWRLWRYFCHLALHATPALRMRFGAVAVALCAQAESMHARPPTWPLVRFLHEQPLDCSLPSCTVVGAFTRVRCTMPLALRAQLVRHREILFADDLWALLRVPSVVAATIGCTVHMDAVARNDVWHAVLAKRNCWIAQADLWQTLTGHFGPATLPCANGICPYPTDNQQRIAGHDPNPPCPIYCRLHSIPTTQHKAAMLQHAQHKPTWWQEHIV